jgi:hypothetical protein
MNKWSINKDKLLKKFLDFYKKERSKKLQELDVEFFKALETDNTSLKSSITNQKNFLRDFPSTITVDDFSNVDELKSLWPTEYLGEFIYVI